MSALKNIPLFGAFLGLSTLGISALHTRSIEPPTAKKVERVNKIGKLELKDSYGWLRDDDRKREDVLTYLHQENTYTESQTKHLAPLEAKLYKKYISHLKEDDVSVPYQQGSFWYSRRTFKGKDYAKYCRGTSMKKQGDEFVLENEEVVLDVNEIAVGKSFCSVGSFQPSPCHKFLAYSIDTSGSEVYDIIIMDIASRKILDTVEKTSGSVSWASSDVLFYSTMDEAHRPNKLFQHTVGTDSSKDTLLLTEDDERFWLGFGVTLSGRFLIAGAGSKVTSEYRVMDLKQLHELESVPVERRWKLVAPRTQDVEYDVGHSGDYFWIVTNENALDFKLMRVAIAEVDKGKSAWEEVIPHRQGRKIDDVDCFKDHLVINGRRKGLTDVEVLYTGAEEKGPESIPSHVIEWPEEAYECGMSTNKQYDTPSIRLFYNSMVTPLSWFTFNFASKELTPLHQNTVPNYDKSQYTCETLTATAADGTKVPMSMVYKNGCKRSSDNHVLLYGYGAYGVTIDPDFDYRRLALLDRGVVYVIAHIRGGGEMGRSWYEQGKYLHKKNTFTDFIACAEHLVKSGFTNPSRLAISGGSAGGLLMGAVVNMRPDLFKAVYTRVPFVDIMNTMSDPSIPLTVIEYEEWGNPCEDKYTDYMLSYSPYDNVAAQDYPAILITTGLNDPRVAYWEPAKWVAKLRATKTDSNVLLLKCKMDAGHFGGSGRYTDLKEKALEHAFILDQLGLSQTD